MADIFLESELGLYILFLNNKVINDNYNLSFLEDLQFKEILL